MDETYFKEEIDEKFDRLKFEIPYIYNALDVFIGLVITICNSFPILSNEESLTLSKELNHVLEAFKVEPVFEDPDEEDEFEYLLDFEYGDYDYEGTTSANFLISAYNHIQNETEAFNIFSIFPIYKYYIKNKGLAEISYDDAIAGLPKPGTPFYEAAKDFVVEAKQSLEDIRDARRLFRKLFELIPKDVYRYDDIKKLYDELMNMYAYETVFCYYVM